MKLSYFILTWYCGKSQYVTKKLREETLILFHKMGGELQLIYRIGIPLALAQLHVFNVTRVMSQLRLRDRHGNHVINTLPT